MAPLPVPAAAVGLQLIPSTENESATDKARAFFDPNEIEQASPQFLTVYRSLGSTLPNFASWEASNEPWTVDWGDGNATPAWMYFGSDGFGMGDHHHEYAAPGTYAVHASHGSDAFDVQALVYAPRGTFEILDAPDLVVAADPYDADSHNARTLMRFLGDDADGALSYYAYLQVNGELGGEPVDVVPIAGSPGVYEVKASFDVPREGDFEMKILLSRGVRTPRMFNGNLYFRGDVFTGEEQLGVMHGRMRVAGRYEPVFPQPETSPQPDSMTASGSFEITRMITTTAFTPDHLLGENPRSAARARQTVLSMLDDDEHDGDDDVLAGLAAT